MSEKAITKSIIKYLREWGCWVEKIHGGPYQRSGLPDLLVFAPVNAGRQGPAPIFIEVKSPTGTLTELQKRTLEKLETYGVKTLVAHSLDAVKTYFEEVLTYDV